VFRFYSSSPALQPQPGFSLLTLLNFRKADVVVVQAYSDADVVQDDYLVPFLAKDLRCCFFLKHLHGSCTLFKHLWLAVIITSAGIHNQFVLSSIITVHSSFKNLGVFHSKSIGTFAMESRQLRSSFALAWAKSWLVERTWKST